MSSIRTSAEKRRTDWAANYREIFNAANDAIFVHDRRTGHILDVNRKACKMYGYSAPVIRRSTVEDLSSGEPPYTQPNAVQRVKRAAKGKPLLFEWHAKNRDGRLFWVEVNLKRVRLSGRDCVLAVVRDITKRKQLKQKLLQLQKTHLNVIAEMNHHIRNAMEAITLSTFASQDRTHLKIINDSIHRIDWALKEILPKL